MKKYAKLEGYKKTDQNIIDFFEVLESWSETMRANFLFFLTGSFKINFEGFKRNPIRITKVSSKGLPVAHTWYIIIIVNYVLIYVFFLIVSRRLNFRSIMIRTL